MTFFLYDLYYQTLVQCWVLSNLFRNETRRLDHNDSKSSFTNGNVVHKIISPFLVECYCVQGKGFREHILFMRSNDYNQ